MKSNYANESKISVHTFMFSRAILGKTWYELKDSFYRKAKETKRNDILQPTKKGLLYKEYKDQGILINLNWKVDKDDFNMTYQHRIEFVINPRRAIGDNTYVGVFEITPKNLNTLTNKIESILCDLGFTGPDGLQSFKLSRADLCINFFLDDIDLFIETIRKCIVPYGFKKYHSCNGKIPKNGVYLKSKKMNIQIYHKGRQLLIDDYELHEDELEQAKNLARFELQFLRPQIYKMIKDNKLPQDFQNGISGVFAALGDMASDFFRIYSQGVFGEEPYYMVDAIISKIRKSSFKGKTKELMLNYLAYFEKFHDADKAFDKLWEQTKRRTIQIEMHEHFSTLGVNIVPIYSKKIKKHKEQPVLPSVFGIVEDNIKANQEYHMELHQLSKMINSNLSYSQEK